MGNWEAALGSAELVLNKEPKNPGAVLIKAEALFNLCDFEHSLLHFCRGQVILDKTHTFLFLSQLLREPTIGKMVFVKTPHFGQTKFFPNSSRIDDIRMGSTAFPAFQGVFSRNLSTGHVTDFKSILAFSLLSYKNSKLVKSKNT